jgi:hypothetical protein
MSERTWPLEPVEAYVLKHWPQAYDQPTPVLTDSDTPIPVGRVYDLIWWTRSRWSNRKAGKIGGGRLSDREAEQIGLELAGEPSAIWRDWYSIEWEEAS